MLNSRQPLDRIFSNS